MVSQAASTANMRLAAPEMAQRRLEAMWEKGWPEGREAVECGAIWMSLRRSAGSGRFT